MSASISESVAAQQSVAADTKSVAAQQTSTADATTARDADFYKRMFAIASGKPKSGENEKKGRLSALAFNNMITDEIFQG